MTGQAGLIDGGLGLPVTAPCAGAMDVMGSTIASDACVRSVPEPAVAVGEDPRRYARLMSAVYDATMAGGRAPARPRSVIEDSWQRMMAKGIDPDALPAPDVESSGLETLRQSSGLIAVLDDVSRGLESLIADGDNILVVADAQGRVLWRCGSPSVLGHADRLGFVEGAPLG